MHERAGGRHTPGQRTSRSRLIIAGLDICTDECINEKALSSISVSKAPVLGRIRGARLPSSSVRSTPPTLCNRGRCRHLDRCRTSIRPRQRISEDWPLHIASFGPSANRPSSSSQGRPACIMARQYQVRPRADLLRAVANMLRYKTSAARRPAPSAPAEPGSGRCYTLKYLPYPDAQQAVTSIHITHPTITSPLFRAAAPTRLSGTSRPGTADMIGALVYTYRRRPPHLLVNGTRPEPARRLAVPSRSRTDGEVSSTQTTPAVKIPPHGRARPVRVPPAVLGLRPRQRCACSRFSRDLVMPRSAGFSTACRPSASGVSNCTSKAYGRCGPTLRRRRSTSRARPRLCSRQALGFHSVRTAARRLLARP